MGKFVEILCGWGEYALVFGLGKGHHKPANVTP